jgi:hypothetical protein
MKDRENEPSYKVEVFDKSMKPDPIVNASATGALPSSAASFQSRAGEHRSDGNSCDYARTFLQFTTDHSRHTPRMQIEASCILTNADGTAAEFFLTAPCMSEHMYRASGLIQEPTSLFWIIAGDNGEFIMHKMHASASEDIREVHRVGEKMSSHDGKGATIQKIEVRVRHLARVRKIETYEEIREAILANKILTGCTRYTGPRGDRIQLNYPVKTCNIPHDRPAWQIDTGPIVMPDPSFSITPQIAQCNAAHILYNQWNWAECALLKPSPAGGEDCKTSHYSQIIRLENVVNELYCEE